VLLRPRKFIYKNIFKRRTFRTPKNNKIIYGQCGLKLLQPVRLNNKQIFRMKLFLKKSSRKFDKTSRYVWFNLFPHLPLSKKVEGSRMGKGVGKLASWFIELPAGVSIFEFRNLRPGRAYYFARQIQHRLPAKTRFLTRVKRKVNTPLSLSRQTSYYSFW
jgi:large subunit ribosomal protein L16